MPVVKNRPHEHRVLPGAKYATGYVQLKELQSEDRDRVTAEGVARIRATKAYEEEHGKITDDDWPLMVTITAHGLHGVHVTIYRENDDRAEEVSPELSAANLPVLERAASHRAFWNEWSQVQRHPVVDNARSPELGRRSGHVGRHRKSTAWIRAARARSAAFQAACEEARPPE